MKLLHTSDWHVGKTIRGASRADEHRAVLRESLRGLQQQRRFADARLAAHESDGADHQAAAEDAI